MTLDERSFYLAQALASASSATNLGAEDVQFKSQLHDLVEVVQVQHEVLRAIATHGDLTEEDKGRAMGALNGSMLDLEEVSGRRDSYETECMLICSC
jgi:hypothetical protein